MGSVMAVVQACSAAVPLLLPNPVSPPSLVNILNPKPSFRVCFLKDINCIADKPTLNRPINISGQFIKSNTQC